jgi:TrmH family RNA methyltransferase
VYEERWASVPAGPLCVYLHGVHDPGNLGTILRSAEAFGATSVALGPGTADPFGPKAVRASMGSVFTVPLVRVDAVADLPGLKIALVPGRGVPLSELWRTGPNRSDQIAKVQDEQGGDASEDDPPADLTLLLGSEREGLPEAVVAAADQIAHIPTATDSLNVAMAATVALHDLANRMASR